MGSAAAAAAGMEGGMGMGLSRWYGGGQVEKSPL